MKIADILQKKGSGVVTIGVDMTLHDTIGLLNEHKIGAVVVTDAQGNACGIVSERDILRECADRCLGDTGSSHQSHGCPAVKDVMTKDLIIGVPTDEVEYVMGIMTKNKIRHLPILDEGKLVGIISIGDVVNASVEEKDFQNRMLNDYFHGMTY